MDDRTNGPTEEQTDGRTDERTDQWMDGRFLMVMVMVTVIPREEVLQVPGEVPGQGGGLRGEDGSHPVGRPAGSGV